MSKREGISSEPLPGGKSHGEAEERACEKPRELRETDAQHLVHELQIRQTAIEAQNEELRQAWAEVEAGRERYADIYDFAPIGYFQLDRTGRILDANFEGAKLLGPLRDALIEQRLTTYVVVEDRVAFVEFLELLHTTTIKHTRELRLLRGEQTIHVLAVGHSARIEEHDTLECRIALIDITDRKRAEDALRQSEKRLHDIIDGLGPDMFVGLMTPDGTMIEINRSSLDVVGLKPEDVLGRPFEETYWWSYSEESKRQLRATIARAASGEPSRYDAQVRVAGNRFIIVDFSLQPLRDSTGEVVYLVPSANVVTNRRRAEERLTRLNRELKAIVQCNQALVRAVDEQTLLNDICRIVCDPEVANYLMAWVGFAEHDESKTVRPVAWSGKEDGYLANAEITWADTERGRGPTGTCIRTGKTCYSQDFATAPALGPWREDGLQRGYRSSLAVPLRDEAGAVFGSITIYSPQPAAFTTEEIRLLEELAGDLAFGVIALRARVQRKRAEELLRQSNDELERRVAERTAAMQQSLDEISDLYNRAPCGYHSLDANGMFVRINDAELQWLGYTRDEIVGKKFFFDLITPKSRDVFDEQFPEFKERGWVHGLEFEMVRKDGTILPVMLGATAIKDAAGHYVTSRSTVFDITERKRAENAMLEAKDELERRVAERTADLARANEQLQTEIAQHKRTEEFVKQLLRDVAEKNDSLEERTRAMEVATRVKNDFISNMSHELRTPLNAILGFSAGLLERADRHPLNEHQKRRIAAIKTSGEHLLTLINDVLDIARIESGKTQVNISTFDIRRVAQEIRDLAEALLKGRPEVGFQLQLDEDLSLITSDRDKFRQILSNLLSNAAKFTPQGTIVVRMNVRGQLLYVEVEDTGIGISEEYIDRVFEKFFQVPNATQIALKGNGLGLAICKAYVEMLGGSLFVHSIEGRGSRFTAALPLCLDVKRAVASRYVEEEGLSSLVPLFATPRLARVLCMETNAANMLLLADYLLEAGYAVIPVSDGMDVMAMAIRERPQAIVIGTFQPEIDDWELLHTLKTAPATSGIPVIVVTSQDEEQLALSLGADGFLRKPISREKLLNLMQRVLSGMSRLTPVLE